MSEWVSLSLWNCIPMGGNVDSMSITDFVSGIGSSVSIDDPRVLGFRTVLELQDRDLGPAPHPEGDQKKP